MRRKHAGASSGYRILVVDDEIGIIESLSVVLRRSGYEFEGVTSPLQAIAKVREEHFDLMILDFLMEPIHGDKVVEHIREFNDELYILLLTGHKDMAPPLDTIKQLEIQGYCEKSDKFDQLLLLIESGIKSVEQRKTIKKFSEGLNKILQSVPKIYQLQPIGNILEEILIELLPFVYSENAFILVDDVEHEGKSIFKGIGEYDVEAEDFSSTLKTELMEQIGYSRRNKSIVKLEDGVILPLINEYLQTMGVIYVESEDFEEGIKLLEIYASQASAALNNAFLHSMVNIKNEELIKTYDELRTSYLDSIETLRLAVDAKDTYTRGHSDRVAYYSVKIGEMFGMNSKEIEILRLGGIFHDIGKIGTSEDILLKREKLTDREYHEIMKHPLKGAHILSSMSMFKDVVPLVLSHHERIDGTGYPECLKGDEIPFMAKIISVSDAFDAMTSDRQYRSRLGIDEAKKQLIKGKGTQFDSGIVDKFIVLLEDFYQMEQEIAATYDM